MAPSNPSPPPPSQTRSTPSRLLRVIAIVVLFLIVLVGLAVLIIWLTVKPKHLIYSIEDASIQGYNLTNTNHLDAKFNFIIRAHNPNTKVSIYYDKIEALVYYDDQTLAFNSIEPFFQPRKNVTRLGLELAAKDVTLFGSVGKDMKVERSSGKIELELKVKARIRFKVGVWKSRRQSLRIECAPVLVYFSSSRTFDRTFCGVDM